jgi:lipopolysaccharide export system permease protein
MVIDFVDRIDNIIDEGTSILLTLEYFLMKIPFIFTLILPISSLIATLFTVGLLSKNSELTAMRASGLTITHIVKPILVLTTVLSFFSLIMMQTVVPYTTRREKEIYNIDIRKKDKTGSYSQSDFWLRKNSSFYSIKNFDSRTGTLYDVTEFQINPNMEVLSRTYAKKADYLGANLGWLRSGVTIYSFNNKGKKPKLMSLETYPLPILDGPENFYHVKTEPNSMSFFELQEFIKIQEANGLSTRQYWADLYDKLAFPLANFIVPLLVISFAVQSQRNHTMARSILAALIIGFSYYALHSFCVSLGRAELLPPLLAAWVTNMLFLLLGGILLVGSESGQ